jgi:thioredoxin 1
LSPAVHSSTIQEKTMEAIERFLNFYSFLWTSALLLMIVAFVLFRERRDYGRWLAFGALVLALFVAWLVLHPRATPLSANAAQVVAQIGQGTPVLLEFQSPFCLGCTALRPVVDDIEQKYRGRLIVLRVNIQSPVGRELAQYYSFEYTPTFIFFDGEGREVWRSVGELDPKRVAASVEASQP